MSTKVHTIRTGDTFESISTRYFGEPSHAGQIRSSNSGVTKLVPGNTVTVLGADEAATVGAEPPGITVRVAGVTLQHFKTLSLVRSVDAFATVVVTTPLPDSTEFRELIQPFKFQTMDVSFAGERLFRGTMLDVDPSVTDEGSTVTLGGYSAPAILHDCMMPPSAYPLQFKNMNIADIASLVASPFGLTVTRLGEMGGPFKRVKIKRDDRVMPFLTNLAQDRQILIRSNPDGDLVLSTPPVESAPVAQLREGEYPLLKIESGFDAQRYYSHTTAVRATGRKRRGGQHTVRNERAVEAGIVRPYTTTVRDIGKGELPKAAEALAGRMLAGSVAYVVTVAGWEDSAGATWEEGSTIELTAPSAFVPRPYNFQIRAVELQISEEGGTVAMLTLMLPGAFGGAAPTVLPWQ